MNIKEFQVSSMRTMPFGGEPGNKQEEWNILSNYTLGLNGEWHELQAELSKIDTFKGATMKEVDVIIKETGDVLHYLVGLLTIVGEEVNEELIRKLDLKENVDEDLANITEIIKKYVYHGHDFNFELFVKSIYRVLSYISTHNGFMLPEVMKKNIDKLKLRYPEKFTVEASKARVDVK